MTVTTEDSRRVVLEFSERRAAGDMSAFDDLVADDFVNHAASPQGREGPPDDVRGPPARPR